MLNDKMKNDGKWFATSDHIFILPTLYPMGYAYGGHLYDRIESKSWMWLTI